MIDFLRGNLYSRRQKFLFFIFLLMCWFNFGNYSWLQYTIDGFPNGSPVFVILRQLRIFLPLVAIISLIFSRIYLKKIAYVIRKNRLLYFLCFLFLSNSIISDNFTVSFIYSFWLFFSVLLINLVIEEVNHLNDLLRLLKFGSLITLLLVLPSLPLLIENNEASYFSSKNYYAFPLLIYIFSDVYLPKSKIKNINRLRILINILILGCLLLSGRRVALVCALISFANYFYFFNKKYLFLIIFLFFSIPTTIISMNFFGIQISESRTFKRIERINKQNNYEDSSYNERLFIWSKYFEAFKDSPIIGNGLNSYDSSLKRHYSGELEGLGYHNTYLQILVECGIIGLFCYLTFIINCIYNMLKFYGFKYFSLVFTILTVNWFETNFMPGQVFFIVSLSILFFFTKRNYERS